MEESGINKSENLVVIKSKKSLGSQLNFGN